MLGFFKRSQPKQLLAVYVEPGLVEVLRGRKKWRSWELDRAQSYPVAPGETPYDCLQRINLRSRGGSYSACLLILARAFYSFHREYYPAALGDQLQEVLEFDWEENLFYEGDRSLHFAGEPIAGQDRFIVPVFSIRSEIYGKFYQALSGEAFRYFTALPSALAFLRASPVSHDPQAGALRIVGCALGDRTVELHHLLNGGVVDSQLVNRSRRSSRLFLAGLDVLTGAETEAPPPVAIYCRQGADPDAAGEEICGDRSGFAKLKVGATFLDPWVRAFLGRDQIKAFGDDLSLKARQLPKVVYPILVCVLLYSLFAFYQVRSHNDLAAQFVGLQTQRKQLEAKWKPIEERRARMAKLQEDQKSLNQFDSKGYPILELLTLVTEITPADTWLEFFSINEKELRLRGQSKAAVKYVSVLSKVEGFENVSLVSPIRRDPRSENERFYLRIKLNSEMLRKRLQGIELMAEEVPVEKPAEDDQASEPETDKSPATEKTAGGSN